MLRQTAQGDVWGPQRLQRHGNICPKLSNAMIWTVPSVKLFFLAHLTFDFWCTLIKFHRAVRVNIVMPWTDKLYHMNVQFHKVIFAVNANYKVNISLVKGHQMFKLNCSFDNIVVILGITICVGYGTVGIWCTHSALNLKFVFVFAFLFVFVRNGRIRIVLMVGMRRHNWLEECEGRHLIRATCEVGCTKYKYIVTKAK